MNSVSGQPMHPQIRRSGWMGLLTRWWFWALLIAFFFAYPIYRSIYRELPGELPIIATVPEYTLIDENAQPFGSKNLEGRVYLANFMFTRCPSVCPKMMQEMVKIQKRVRGTGQKVALVSFTVEPEHDTPQVLFKTARDYKSNPYIWSYLTSEDKDGLFKLYRDGFKVNVADKEPAKDMYDIAHSEKIVLVDQVGRIRGYYSFDTNSVNQLMIDVGLLINRPVTKE